MLTVGDKSPEFERIDHKTYGGRWKVVFAWPKFPMMADPRHELMRGLGIEDEEGFARRAVFVVDQNNEIQFSMVTAGSVGRNPREVLRVLDALQTDELCPCNWTRGEKTLGPVALPAGA